MSILILTIPVALHQMCHAFLPIMAKNGRIVNMSSVGSSLKPYSEAMRQRFRNPNASQQDLDQLADDFLVRPNPLSVFLRSKFLYHPFSLPA